MAEQKSQRNLIPIALAAMTLVWLVGIGVIVIGAAALSDGGGGGGGGEEVTGTITLTEFAITGDLVLPPGDIVLTVVNEGSVQHNLSITELGAETPMINSGDSVELPLGTLEPGVYEIVCTVAGHKSSGMLAQLTIAEEGSDVATAAAGSHDHSDPVQNKADDESMLDSMAKFVDGRGATEGVGNVPLEPTILPDGTKEFELTADITKWEVEPGKIVDAWTYNGIVPGPWIKVNVGDKVRVKFTNNLPVISDIHWHGIHVPNNMDGVAPYTQDAVEANGGTFDYEFVADEPSIGMYHAHAHGEVALPNGMFGMFQIGEMPIPRGMTVSGVEIPSDLKVSQELPMVLNDAGNIGYSLNGKSFPATAPITVGLNEWFVVHYQNEGLQVHPMHMHGFPQLIIAKDGIPLDQPYWADTVLVSPGERYTVLVQATDPGVWVWHCHILNHVEQADRLFGMATAVIVE